MNVHLEVDPATAIKIGQFFERDGVGRHADDMWRAICDTVAYDRKLRAQCGEVLFDSRCAKLPAASVERLRCALFAMAMGFPTEKLVGAYFENLEGLLRERPKRPEPGKLILGVGTGRCGSTTLSAAFAAVPGACATHENPPHVYWQPLAEQVEFHFRRLHLLADYFPLVFDAAHWWLNLKERFFTEFPGGRMIGLVRDTDACVRSKLKFQGRGRRSYNTLAAPDIEYWVPGLWAPTYPSYGVPDGALANENTAFVAKARMFATYIEDYNRRLVDLAEAEPQRFLVIRTEAMSDPATAERLSALAGTPVAMPAVSLNVGNNFEGATPECWY